jgi:hypothetical protein
VGASSPPGPNQLAAPGSYAGALPGIAKVVTETSLEVLEIDLIVADSFFSDEIKA